MHGPGDVGFFRLIAPLYDLTHPSIDPGTLRGGLEHAERPVDRVVDVGGGTGRAIVAVTAGGGDGESPGGGGDADGGRGESPADLDGADRLVVDATPAMVRRAGEKGFAAVAGDAGRLPLAEASVDAVISVDAFHHFPDREAAMAEVVRVLRPGGVLVVRDLEPGHPIGWAIAAVEHALGMTSTFPSAIELASLVADAGLEVASIEPGGFYTVVGVKPWT